MLGILLDAVILTALMQAFLKDEADFVTSAILAFGASLLANLSVMALISFLGLPLALACSAILTALILGVLISMVLGAPFKTSCIVSALFMVIHFAVSVGLFLAMRS